MEYLKQLLSKEHELGKSIHRAYVSRTSNEVGSNLRDKAMSWLRVLNHNFSLQPDSFVLAVHIFDKFLLKTKVQVKYLRCVAITAYFISVKAVEENENIPTINNLLEASQCGCSKSDVLQMEIIMLRTIEWKLYVTTPMLFLQHFYQTLFGAFQTDIDISRKLLIEAEEIIQDCMCRWQLTQFKSSVLALAVLLNKFQGNFDKAQLQIIQNLAKIDKLDLLQCKLLLLTDKSDNNNISIKELLQERTVDVIHLESTEKLEGIKT